MADPEPSAYELMRVIERIERKLDSVLTVEVFRAHQEGTDRRFTVMETDLTEWKAESRGAHVALDARITAQRERQEASEERQRADRQKNWLAIGMGVLGVLFSVATAVLSQALTGGP